MSLFSKYCSRCNFGADFTISNISSADILNSLNCSFNSESSTRCLQMPKLCDSVKCLKRNNHTDFNVFNFEIASAICSVPTNNALQVAPSIICKCSSAMLAAWISFKIYGINVWFTEYLLQAYSLSVLRLFNWPIYLRLMSCIALTVSISISSICGTCMAMDLKILPSMLGQAICPIFFS